VMMNDAMFEAMCESPQFIEELLQIILQNSKLHIIYDSVVTQKSIKNLKGRSVRLDAYVEGKEDIIFNIELQRADNCNHIKRVRYNASVITANNSETGDEFEHIQELCMVYITEKDFFKKGLTLYHVQNTILETGDVLDNGLKEIYVNTEVNDGSEIAEFMKLFHKKELDVNDQKKFPNTFEKFNNIKHDSTEVNHMCEKIESYAKKKAIYAVIAVLEEINMPQDQIKMKIMSRFNLSEEEANKYYEDFFSLVQS